MNIVDVVCFDFIDFRTEYEFPRFHVDICSTRGLLTSGRECRCQPLNCGCRLDTKSDRGQMFIGLSDNW